MDRLSDRMLVNQDEDDITRVGKQRDDEERRDLRRAQQDEDR